MGAVAACVALEWEVDPDTGAVRECVPGVMAAFSLLTIAADLVNPIRLQV